MRINIVLQSIVCSLLFFPLLPMRMAQATTAVERTFPDLVHRAEVVAVGTVTNVREQWDAARRAPFTYVTFSHLTMLKGTAQEETLTLEFLGGHEPDGTLLVVHGVPHFSIGEKTVIFCTGNRRDGRGSPAFTRHNRSLEMRRTAGSPSRRRPSTSSSLMAVWQRGHQLTMYSPR